MSILPLLLCFCYLHFFISLKYYVQILSIKTPLFVLLHQMTINLWECFKFIGFFRMIWLLLKICYIKEKERLDSSGRLHLFCAKAAISWTRAAFFIYSFLFLKYERTAITVPITVATQVTKAIISSQVICKPPFQLFRL